MDKKHRSLVEAIDEVERETLVRARCFPRWVTEGKMTRTDALDRSERMEAALYYLRGMDPDRPPEPPPATGISQSDIDNAKALFAKKQAKELAAAEKAGQKVAPDGKDPATGLPF